MSIPGVIFIFLFLLSINSSVADSRMTFLRHSREASLCSVESAVAYFCTPDMIEV